jgi:probable HAF family extracellular repeat protein
MMLVLFAAATAVGAGSGQDQDLETFVCPGQGQTIALGINARGDIVGWTGPGYWMERHGFLRKDGDCTTFDVPNSWGTIAVKINARGQIVGWYYDPNAGGSRRGFLLEEGQFTTLVPPGAVESPAFAINARGEIVGYYADESGVYHGYLLKDGQYETIDYPEGRGTWAVSITDAGEIAGAYRDENWVGHPFVRKKDGSFLSFDPPPQSSCDYGFEVWDMNLMGVIVGRCWRADGARGFLLKNGEYTLIQHPGAAATLVHGINAESQFVGVAWWDAGWNLGDALIGRMKKTQ